jgi:hypothetical protein
MNLIVESYSKSLLSPLVFGCLESLAEPAHLSSSYEAPLSRHTLELCKCDHASALTVLIVGLYLLDKFLPPLIDCQDLFLELILLLWVGFHGHLKHLFLFEEFVEFQKQAHPSIVTQGERDVHQPVLIHLLILCEHILRLLMVFLVLIA